MRRRRESEKGVGAALEQRESKLILGDGDGDSDGEGCPWRSTATPFDLEEGLAPFGHFASEALRDGSRIEPFGEGDAILVGLIAHPDPEHEPLAPLASTEDALSVETLQHLDTDVEHERDGGRPFLGVFVRVRVGRSECIGFRQELAFGMDRRIAGLQLLRR